MKDIHRINRINLNTKEYWNNRFVTGNTNNGTSGLESIIEWISDNFSINEESNILDIGSGPNKTESFLNRVKDKFECNCYLVDISDEICSSWEGTKIESSNSSLPNLDFDDNKFDLVLCSHTLEHIDDIENSIEEIKRITKSGGIVIINSPIGEVWSTENEHVWWFGDNLDFEIGNLIDSFPGNQYKSRIQIYKNE